MSESASGIDIERAVIEPFTTIDMLKPSYVSYYDV